MIRVKRTSPVYAAVLFTGDYAALVKEISELGIKVTVVPHQRDGHPESIYAMVQFDVKEHPTFIQQGEYMLFNEQAKSFVSVVSHYGFNYAFETL